MNRAHRVHLNKIVRFASGFNRSLSAWPIALARPSSPQQIVLHSTHLATEPCRLWLVSRPAIIRDHILGTYASALQTSVNAVGNEQNSVLPEQFSEPPREVVELVTRTESYPPVAKPDDLVYPRMGVTVTGLGGHHQCLNTVLRVEFADFELPGHDLFEDVVVRPGCQAHPARKAMPALILHQQTGRSIRPEEQLGGS